MKRLLLVAGILAASTNTALGQAKGPSMPYPPRDVERPITLPPLGKYQPDKVGATDPVAEASQSLVGRVGVVARPATPFLRMTVPDPFEYRNLLRLPAPVPEETMPPLLVPRK